MKMKIIFGLLVCLAFVGCDKSDEVSPSYKDVDWYSVEDDPNDPLTHLRYTIYKEEGVPIFYNDTLGSQIRYDKRGESYTYYEVIKVGYTITNNVMGMKYTLADDLTDVMNMVELMDQYLFEYLPKGKRPLSYLLVDTVRLTAGTSNQYFVYDDFYKAMTTTCVGNIEKVKDMSNDEKQILASELAGLEFINSITEDSDLTGELISHFDSLATSVKLETTYAPTAMGTTGSSGFGNVMIGNVSKIAPEAELFGLIRYRRRNATQFFMPTKDQDRAAYIGMILRLSDEEIRRKYENYPVVIARYELMLEIMEKVGLIEREGV